MTPQVFVVDTNVVVAGLLTRATDSPVVRILDAMLSGELVYLLSPELLAEYQTVLMRPKLAKRHHLSQNEVDAVLAELAANAMWREPDDGATAAPDAGDDHLWTLLETYRGSILITGDMVLREKPPAHHSVISPRSWAQDISGQPDEHDDPA
ncbi:MAG: putative toxin-antitoxin system toxin component, PIN family [Gammaproteobacteria bacterium]|nr:putative toxin-antitoxin system toxin component, PIN family [Gammaproteobacteria bacterium]